MKLAKKLAVLAIAATVIFAGCENSFSGSNLSTGALDAYNDGSVIHPPLTTPSSIDLTNGDITAALAAAADQIITINFNTADGIDESTIANAVTISKLASGASTTAAYVATPLTKTLVSFRNGVATFKLDLTGVTEGVEVFVNSTILTGRNGARKLNLDEDSVQGEAGDDDLYRYFTTGAGYPATGDQRVPRRALVAGMSAMTLNTITGAGSISITLGNTDLTDDFTSILQANSAIQLYNESSDSWADITSTITKATLDYTYAFTGVAEGKTYRVMIKDVQAFKTSTAYRGFVIKATYDGNERTAVFGMTTAPFAATIQYVGSPFTAYTKNCDASDKNVYIDMPFSILANSIVGDKGLDSATVTKDNLKLYDQTDKVFLNISSIELIYASASQTSGVKDRVRIYLDPSIKCINTHPVDLWIGPGLKSLGDTTPGTVARKFGNVSNITEKPYGFFKVTSAFTL